MALAHFLLGEALKWVRPHFLSEKEAGVNLTELPQKSGRWTPLLLNLPGYAAACLPNLSPGGAVAGE